MSEHQDEAEQLAAECTARLHSEYSREWFDTIPAEQQPRYVDTFNAAEKVRKRMAELLLMALPIADLLAARDERDELNRQLFKISDAFKVVGLNDSQMPCGWPIEERAIALCQEVEKLRSLNKERNQLRAELASLKEKLAGIIAPAEVGGGIEAYLRSELATVRAELVEQKAIVDRCWKALGIVNYEQAKPLTIDQHIEKLRTTNAPLMDVARAAKQQASRLSAHTLIELKDALITLTESGAEV